jgi:hypothetical protein
VSEDPVLAALARLEEGQKAIRDRLERVEQDRAVLFDALGTLSARLDGLKTALAPTLERLDRLDLLLRGLAGQARMPGGATETTSGGPPAAP